MTKTLFDYVDDDLFYIYRTNGFDWDEARYINIFRWLWNEKHLHPRIESFPGDEQNKAFVLLERPKLLSNKYRCTADSYDEAIINIVEYIGKNYEEYL